MLTNDEIDRAVEASVKLITIVAAGHWSDGINETVILPNGILPVIKIVESFINSNPYEVIDYREDRFQLTMLNRVDILAAFKRHARARIKHNIALEELIPRDDDLPLRATANEPFN
jgi:hypothetical protein